MCLSELSAGSGAERRRQQSNRVHSTAQQRHRVRSSDHTIRDPGLVRVLTSDRQLERFRCVVCQLGPLRHWAWVGTICQPCPTGGFCPGGGRVWPLPGYWSFDERLKPQACGLPQACPGAISDPELTTGGQRLTSVCAPGYRRSLCADCDIGYYSTNNACVTCGLESTEKAELYIVLLVAVAVFFAMAVAVATLSAKRLAGAVSALLLMQHLSVVGKLGGSQVASSMPWVSELFTVLSMLNFDLQFVKPGCAVGEMSFLTAYWATLGLLALTSMLFATAAAIRSVTLSRSQREERAADAQSPATPPAVTSSHGADTGDNGGISSGDTNSIPSKIAPLVVQSLRRLPLRDRFIARLIHAHLILGSAVYLRVTTMTLQALQCRDVVLQQDAQPTSVLAIDLTTHCYTGEHLITAVLAIWPVMFLYCIGFPLLTAVILYRNFHRAAKRALSSTSAASDESSVQMADNSSGRADDLYKTSKLGRVDSELSVGSLSPSAQQSRLDRTATASIGSSPLFARSPSRIESRLRSVARGYQYQPQQQLIGADRAHSSSKSASVCASPSNNSRPLATSPSHQHHHRPLLHVSTDGECPSPLRPQTPTPTLTPHSRAYRFSQHQQTFRSVGAAQQPKLIRESEGEVPQWLPDRASSSRSQPALHTFRYQATLTELALPAADDDNSPTATGLSQQHVQQAGKQSYVTAEMDKSVIKAAIADAVVKSRTIPNRESGKVRQALRELSKDLKRQEQFGSAALHTTLTHSHNPVVNDSLTH